MEMRLCLKGWTERLRCLRACGTPCRLEGVSSFDGNVRELRPAVFPSAFNVVEFG